MGDSDDDLGAFFDEVCEAEEEAKKELSEPEKWEEATSNVDSDDIRHSSEYDTKVAPQAENDLPPSKRKKHDDYTSPARSANETETKSSPSPIIDAAHVISAAPIVFQRAAPVLLETFKQVSQNHPFEIFHAPIPQIGMPSVPGAPPLPLGSSSYSAPHNESNAPFQPPPGSTIDPGIIRVDGIAVVPKAKPRVARRAAAGKEWVDPTMQEWPDNDFRLFVGNLGKEMKNDDLFDHFKSRYSSVAMVRVVYDKNNQSKGFGFVSLLDPLQAAKAIREMNDSFLGARPLKVKRSDWKERDQGHAPKKIKRRGRR